MHAVPTKVGFGETVAVVVGLPGEIVVTAVIVRLAPPVTPISQVTMLLKVKVPVNVLPVLDTEPIITPLISITMFEYNVVVVKVRVIGSLALYDVALAIRVSAA